MNPLALRLPVTAACILTLAGTALGQNALGGGRALDGGLSTMPGGRVNASTQDLQAIVKFNSNAGNALNGPGFTNRVPMGSNSLNTGGSSSRFGSSSGILSGYRPSASGSYDSYAGFDRIAALEAGYMSQGALTSSISLPQGTAPSDYSRGGDQSVGYTRDRQGGYYIARGSALRGLSIEPLVRQDTQYDPLNTAPKTGTAATYGRVIDELRRASLARAIENPDRVDNSAAPAGTANPAAAGAPPKTADPAETPGTTGTTAKPAPGTGTGNNATTPAPAPGAAPVQYDPNATLQRLRDKLTPGKPKDPVTTDAARAKKPDGVTTADPSNTAATSALTEEDINALRSMGLKLETLVPAGASDAQASDGYTRLGQEALTAGHFGLADQMFQSAVSRNPGNVLAKAGGLHATMGLGLLMTAGGDLRQYFVDHPEMIPIRFNDTILMPRGRADRLAELLNTDLDRVDGPLLPNAGLTLAYLGRQFDNPTWLGKGLTAMATQTKNDAQGTELHAILVRVWNAPDAPAAPTAPAPLAPPPPAKTTEPSK